jgi:hypothetical protein
MIQVDKQIIDMALGLLFRKEFSIDEIPTLNKVVEALAPLVAEEVESEQETSE